MTVKVYNLNADLFSDAHEHATNVDVVHYSDYSELQRKAEALTAENSGLSSAAECLLHEASEVYRAYNKTQLPDGNLVDEQSLQEVYDAINATPATDAALAEIRAQGVEMFVNKILSELRSAGGGNGYHTNFYPELADHLESKGSDFSSELRKESGQ